MHDEHRGSRATVSESVIGSDNGAEITELAPSRSVRAIGEETMRTRSHDKQQAYITHQVFVFVINARILSCVVHPLEPCRFSSIRSTDDKDAKAAVFGSEFCSFFNRVDWSRCYSGSGEERSMGTVGGLETG